jgi:hypothetical protein
MRAAKILRKVFRGKHNGGKQPIRHRRAYPDNDGMG